MASKLGEEIAQAQRRASSPATAQTAGTNRLQNALAGHRVRKPIMVPIVPGHSIAAVMTIVGSERSLDIEGEVVTAMANRGLEQNVLNQEKFELELAMRTLAEAVLDSEASPVPLGSLHEWGELAPEVIADLWGQYSELRTAFDPSLAELSAAEVAELREAVAKKNARLLRFFGARRLSAFLLTLADQLASCGTWKSSPGDSLPAS